MNKIQEEIPELELARLKELQNIGIKTIMRVVEIKSEED